MSYFVKIKEYYAAKYTVTYGFWNNVCDCAEKLGYDISKRGKNPSLPAGLVNYYDAVKFCNALNEILGLQAVYYNGDEIYRCGIGGNITKKGKGIRLPDKDEWEYSVQKDLKSRYFWGEQIMNNKDNPYAWMYEFHDKISPFAIRKPGLKKPNEFGLYDVLGNVCEWTNDTFSDTGYRIIKGGSVALDCVLDTHYDALFTDYARLHDVGIRLFSDTDIEIPENLLKENPCDYKFVNDKFDFFSLLDFDNEEIKDVVILYNDGKYMEAKRAYLKKLKNIGEKFPYRKPANYLEFMKKYDRYMNASGELEPYIKDEDIIVSDYAYLGVLFEKYLENKEEKYIKQMVYLLNQSIAKNKNNFDNLTNEELNESPDWNPNSWNYMQGFDSANRATAGLKALTDKLLVYIKDEHLTDEAVEAFIGLITAVVTEDIPCWLKDARKGVPNQYTHTAMEALEISIRLPGIRESKNYYKLGKDRLLDAVFNQTVLKDGSDMEQGYNYNHSVIGVYGGLNKIFGEDMPEEFKPVKELIIKRIRFLKGISTPVGGQPASGTVNGGYSIIGTDEEKKAFIEKTKNKSYLLDKKNPEFLSVNFPYSNTTIMRNSYDFDATYMWHMGARQGMGHAIENINSIQLYSKGIPMLVNSGAGTYFNKSFIPESQWDMMMDFETYRESTFAANSGVIDNMGQARLKYGENITIPVHKNTAGKGFYTDSDFTYSESEYSGEYYDKKNSLNATHVRKVIYSQNDDVFFVLDEFDCKGEHEFGLIYQVMPYGGMFRDNTSPTEEVHYADGYRKEEVKYTDNRIYTERKGGPNFEIYSLCGKKVNITDYYGTKNPLYGWFSGAIRSERKEKHDFHIKWKDCDKAVHLSIIAISQDDIPAVKSVDSENNAVSVTLKNGKILTLDEKGVKSGDKEILFKNVKIPADFNWIETENGYKPDYSFK